MPLRTHCCEKKDEIWLVVDVCPRGDGIPVSWPGLEPEGLSGRGEGGAETKASFEGASFGLMRKTEYINQPLPTLP